MNYKKLDRMLEKLQQKNTPAPDEFVARDEFKAKFHQKIESQTVSSSRHLKFYLVTAAAACVVIGMVFIPLWLSRPSAGGADPAAVLPPEAAPGPQHYDVPETGHLVYRGEAEPIPEPAPAVMREAPQEKALAAPVKKRALRKTGRRSLAKRNAPAAPAAPAAAVAAVEAPEAVEEEYSNPLPRVDFNTGEYKNFTENPFVNVKDAPLSTFGADVDSGSYVNVRHYLLRRNSLPPRDAVRIEEFVNFFRYDYPQPAAGKKFSVTFESAPAPWNHAHKLVLIGVQAAEIPIDKLPPANYVFLVDNSGSMYNEMPKVQAALSTMLEAMRPQDRLSLITYGGGVKVLLDGASCEDKTLALKQIKALASGGYTPGSDGIQKAYQIAHKHFIKNGNNRIVLVSDGDFNVGVSSESELVKMVEKERSSLIYLSVFGMGYGNYHENKLKMLANKGNGNYYYIDDLREARTVMQACFAGRMFAIARDAKFQVEFNPAQVKAYRLLGYEMRTMAARDFNDDSKDGGEIGVGHQVTVLYEIVPTDAPAGAADGGSVDELKYQKRTTGNSSDILTCKLRYQLPQEKAPSVLESFVLSQYPDPGRNLRWAASVAEFAMLLRDSQYKGNADYRILLDRARIALGKDPDGKRAEFLMMVRNAMELSK